LLLKIEVLRRHGGVREPQNSDEASKIFPWPGARSEDRDSPVVLLKSFPKNDRRQPAALLMAQRKLMRGVSAHAPLALGVAARLVHDRLGTHHQGDPPPLPAAAAVTAVTAGPCGKAFASRRSSNLSTAPYVIA
jgi:hypothetical protein